MSNDQKSVDLLKTGEATITEIINGANETQFAANALIIGAPRPSADTAYNTDIEVTVPLPPLSGGDVRDPVTGEFHYNRLDLQILFANKNIRLHNQNYVKSVDLIPALAEEVRIIFDMDDIESEDLGTGDYPRIVILKAAPNSLRFIGQFSIDIQEPLVDDPSFLTAPVVQTNVTPSQKALKTDGTLTIGTGNLAGMMFKASNGEIELAAAARLYKLNQAIPSKDGKYKINIADEGDWSLPFSLLLLDNRNGNHLTDLYDITLKITSQQTNGVLRFALQRLYGKLRLVDVDNQLVIDDPNVYNADQTLYQDIQRVMFYKNKLGSLTLNSAKAPYGTFAIELKAVRKVGVVDPVVVSFIAEIAGLPPE